MTISDIRLVFMAWERLRPLFNLCVGATGMLFVLPVIGSLQMMHWLFIAVYAFGANACYFSGPAVEAYVAWLGWKSPVVRIILFATGTLFSIAMTFIQGSYAFMVHGFVW